MRQLGNVDIFIGMKLHAVVLAAAANVPAISLEYRPKCRDFCASIDWEDYCVKTSELREFDVVARVGEMMAGLNDLRLRLSRSVNVLHDAFIKYCTDLRRLCGWSDNDP